MSTPQPGNYQDHPQGHGQYEQQQYKQYDGSQPAEYADNASPVQGGPTPSSNAARKKRHYAGQAYEFGAGGNAALGGQAPGGVYPGPPGAGYGGYGQQQQQQPQQLGYQQPAYGAPQQAMPSPGQPAYGQSPAAAGYQPPEPGYPSHGAPPLSPGMGGVTQGMSNMGFGGQAPPQGQHMQQRVQLNQLYPTDLLNQPLNVHELELPPPPIILPPNVRSPGDIPCIVMLTSTR